MLSLSTAVCLEASPQGTRLCLRIPAGCLKGAFPVHFCWMSPGQFDNVLLSFLYFLFLLLFLLVVSLINSLVQNLDYCRLSRPDSSVQQGLLSEPA